MEKSLSFYWEVLCALDVVGRSLVAEVCTAIGEALVSAGMEIHPGGISYITDGFTFVDPDSGRTLGFFEYGIVPGISQADEEDMLIDCMLVMAETAVDMGKNNPLTVLKVILPYLSDEQLLAAAEMIADEKRGFSDLDELDEEDGPDLSTLIGLSGNGSPLNIPIKGAGESFDGDGTR